MRSKKNLLFPEGSLCEFGSCSLPLRFQFQFEASVHEAFLFVNFEKSFFFSLKNLHPHSSFLSSGLLANVFVLFKTTEWIGHLKKPYGIIIPQNPIAND